MRTLILWSVILTAAPAHAQGGTTVDAIPIGRIVLRELAGQPADPPHAVREHVRPAPAATQLATDAVAARLEPGPRGVAPAPRLAMSFLATANDNIYPADASGAVGPHHIVGAFNDGIFVFDRDGTPITVTSLTSFWHAFPNPDGTSYDSRVAYDAAHDRWVLASLNDVNQQQGVLLLAITATSDPSGAWIRYRIAVSSDTSVTGDFTRLALAADQIVITANLVGSTQGAEIFVVPLAAAYAGPSSPLPVTRIVTLSSELIPVSDFDRGDSTMRVVQLSETDPNVLIAMRIVNGALVTDASYRSPLTASFADPGLIGPQLGSARYMDAGFRGIHYAVARNGTLWAVESVLLQQSGATIVAACVRIWKIRDSSAAVLAVSDPSGATSYAFPSIAANAAGGALVAYSQFNASYYPSSGCIFIDAAGNMSAPMLLDRGAAPYIVGRWGDFTTTVTDPVDDTFWTLQLYTPSAPALPQQWWAASFSHLIAPLGGRQRAIRH